LIHVRDQGGDENYRLYSVGKDGSDPLDLTPFDGVQCGIVDDLEEIDEEILFQMNRRNPEIFDVYRLNVQTGEMSLIAENPGNIGSWITDHQGKLRLATTTDGVNTSILFRERETDDWQKVATYNFKEGAQPLFFTFDNRSIYVTSNVGRDRSAIFEYDLTTGKEGSLIGEHPEVDISGLMKSTKRKKITGMVFETARMGYRFFDATRQRIQDLLDAELPGKENRLISHSRDESRFVVYSGNDLSRGSYWLLDAGKSKLSKLFELSPWLREEDMSAMEPISYRTADGLTIHGYLTLPAGRDPNRLPLVVHPHGGPWVRDSWGFDPEIQFLANRGAAVLQVNYRGSTGYGRKFWEASFGQWGLAMQEDLSEGVRWAIAAGIADPQRIAIYGGSYGGYAALAGLTRDPALYACGVSYVGVSNLFTWIDSIPPYWKPYLEMIYEMVGHPEKDRERLTATSPYFNAAKIRVPLLVAQGANDPRVRKKESDQIVEALGKRGVAVEYLVKDNEGHGFRNEENQFEFYRALEAFLTRHLRLDSPSS
ncbi:MAG: S9 family peptidase, partial [Acidobacteriota bacterium]